jgi:Bacterial Ig-like domain/Divergent InlB B-repeat domain
MSFRKLFAGALFSLLATVFSGHETANAWTQALEPSVSDFLVNTTTNGTQNLPVIGSIADGGYAIAWADNSMASTNGSVVRAQRYDTNHARIGSEFIVNVAVSQAQSPAAVIGLSGGGFVIVYRTPYARFVRYNADGSIAGADTGITGDGIVGFIPMGGFALDNNRFAILTNGLIAGGGANTYIHFFDATGTPEGAPVELLPGEGNTRGAFFGDGSFILVWGRTESGDPNVIGRRFNADGTPSGAEFRINTNLVNRQNSPRVAALENGQFLAAWQDTATINGVIQPSNIFARIFDNNGTPDGAAFEVPTTTDGSEAIPEIIGLMGGGFLISWVGDSTNDSDPSGQGVFARNYLADGTAVGNEFRVNGITENTQSFQEFIGRPDGGFVATYAGGTGTLENDDGVVATAFAPAIGRPTITGISRNGANEFTNTDSLVFGINFSNNVVNVTADDFVISGTTATGVIGGSNATYTLTISGGDLADLHGTVSIRVSPSQDIQDPGGNPLVFRDPATYESYTLDNTVPSIHRISRDTPSGALTRENALRFEIVFTEPVINVTGNGFIITGTTATGVYTPNTTSRGWLDVSGGDLAGYNGNVGVDIAPGQNITDIHGNALDPTEPTHEDAIYILDNLAPTIVSIARFNPLHEFTNLDSLQFIVTFSEKVSSISVGDFVLAGSTANASNVALTEAVTQTNYAVTFSGGDLAQLNGVVELVVAPGHSLSDEAGNALTNRMSTGVNETYTLDNIAPTVAISGPAGPVNSPFTATFTFSESVIDFTIADIQAGNGSTITNFQTISDSVYSATIVPAFDGVVTVNIPANAARDAAINHSLAAPQFSLIYDTTPPRVTSITNVVPGSSPTNLDSVTFRVIFDEAITNLTSDDFLISSTTGTITANPISPSTYDLVIAGGDMPDLDAVIAFSIFDGQDIADLAGNALVNLTPTGANDNALEIDNTPPRITAIERVSPTTAATNADTLIWRVSFDDEMINVTNPAMPAFQASGTTAETSVLYRADSSVLEITVSGGDLPDLNGTVTLGFSPGHTTADHAGNLLTNFMPIGLNEDSFVIDNLAPTVSLTTDAADPVLRPFELTATFSETVTGFNVNDLRIANGVATGFQQVSGSEYIITIAHGTDSTTTVDIWADAVIDHVGNGSEAADQFSIGIIPHKAMSVSLPGVGGGTVTSAPDGIECGETCFEIFELGSEVTLTATPDSESSFAGWTAGPCAGSAEASCLVTMNGFAAVAARFTLNNPPEGRIVAAALPGARSSFLGGPVMTAFLSVVSRATTPAQNCRVAAPENAPFTLSYQELNGATPTGPVDPVFDLNSGGAISLLIAMAPTLQTGSDGYVFLPQIACENADLAPIEGVSSVLVSIGGTPVPDILSIGATSTADGVVRIPASGNRIAFMAASAVNIGAGDGSAGANQATVTVTVDTGAAQLPVTLEVCESDANGCLSPRGRTSVQTVFDQNAAKTFTVFVRANGSETVAFDPANSRVFLRFSDSNGSVRSVTSAAISAPAASDYPEILASAAGRWSVLVRQDANSTPLLRRASLYLTPRGDGILDDGVNQRRIVLDDIQPSRDNTMAAMSGYPVSLHPHGTISVGDALSDQPQAFWGVRDIRDPANTDWAALTGRFGDVLITSEGEVRGMIDTCAVYGDTAGGGVLSIRLSGCRAAGAYLAIADLPANDRAAALIIAGVDTGWRLERH